MARDLNAPTVYIDDGGMMLDWLAQAYSEVQIYKILATVIEFHWNKGVSESNDQIFLPLCW